VLNYYYYHWLDWVKLTQSGVSEQDIVNIAAVFEKYVAGIDRQSFVTELDKYGGLKSAIQKFTNESDSLRKEVGSLETQRRELNTDNQRMLSNIVDSRHTFDYLHGRVDSLRNEILGLLSAAGCITYLIKLQFNYLEDLRLNYAVDGGDEFVSLTKAYKGEEPVTVQEMKKEVIKAIELLRSKLDVNNKLSEILYNTRLALMDKANN
jgi:uncharacterized coiled-coil DUF342 family protein